jgi:hypothetical protein
MDSELKLGAVFPDSGYCVRRFPLAAHAKPHLLGNHGPLGLVDVRQGISIDRVAGQVTKDLSHPRICVSDLVVLDDVDR